MAGKRATPDCSAPITVAQAERLILVVLRAYGAKVVEETPILARAHVRRIVEAVNKDLTNVVRRALLEPTD